MKISFTKMQGLGNDFVVIDATQTPFSLTSTQIQGMANRRLGVGFDQLLVLEPPHDTKSDFHFRIFNADGGEVSQCGNGARCIALFIREKKLSAREVLIISTQNDHLKLKLREDGKVTVTMGVPKFHPTEIPFLAKEESNFYEVPLPGQKIRLSVVNIGNPHAIVQVDEICTDQVRWLGPLLSRHPYFPAATNVGFMQVIDPINIRLRAYERGTGETLACGSGACAAVAVGRRNGWLQERVTVAQPGGSLLIDWQGPGTLLQMTGEAAFVFHGHYDL